MSIVIHERTSLNRFSSSISTCPSMSSSFPSTSCTSSCTLNSTTWSPWKTCYSANKGSDDAYDTSPPPSHRQRSIKPHQFYSWHNLCVEMCRPNTFDRRCNNTATWGKIDCTVCEHMPVVLWDESRKDINHWLTDQKCDSGRCDWCCRLHLLLMVRSFDLRRVLTAPCSRIFRRSFRQSSNHLA